MKKSINNKYLLQIANRPHLIGHAIGKHKLTDTHSDWIKWIWCGGKENRALQAHRGSYKTTAIGLVGSMWWLLFHPDDRIAIIRKSFTDAAQVTSAMAAAFQLPELQYIFYLAHGSIPYLTVNKYGALTLSFKRTITPEHSITALGIDTGITGKHFDKILGDDLITLRDRISQAEREKTKEIIRETSTNIIEEGQGVGFIGTPWHRNDGWEVIKEFAEIKKYPVSKLKIFNEEELAKRRKTTTPALYALNYDLDIQQDDKALFKNPRYGKFDILLPGAIAHLDAAFDGDHTCALTIMTKRPDGQWQGIGWVYPGNVKDWLPFIAKMYKQYRVKILHNEYNADKGYTADKLKGMGVNAHTYDELQNKGIKISTYLYQAWDQIIWDESMQTEEMQMEYMNQNLDWQEGMEPDDAPDSGASLLREAWGDIIRAGNDSLYQW